MGIDALRNLQKRKGLAELLSEFCEKGMHDVNAAIVENPNLGLLERMKLKFGQKVSDAMMNKVALTMSASLVEQKDLLEADETLILEGGAELQRLITILNALPLSRDIGSDGHAVVLAVGDPTSSHVRSVFKHFFDAQIKVVLGRESELQRAINYKVGGARSITDTSVWNAVEAENSASEKVLNSLLKILEVSISARAYPIEITFEPNGVTFGGGTHFDRKRPEAISVDPNSLVTCILENSRVEEVTRNGFTARMSVFLHGEPVDARIQFFKIYESKLTSGKNMMIIDDFVFNSETSLSAYLYEDPATHQRLIEQVTVRPGIYFISALSEDARNRIGALLKSSVPTGVLAKNFDNIREGSRLLLRAQYCPVFVPLEVAGLQAAIQKLEALSRQIRPLVQGILTHLDGPQTCPLCSVECELGSMVKSVLPAELSSQYPTAWYPRGCQVCSSSGFVGQSRSTDFHSFHGSAGAAFRQGSDAKSVFAAFTQEGVQPGLLTFLAQSRVGSTNPESIIRFVAGKSELPQSECLAAGKKPARAGDPTSPCTKSPLFEEVVKEQQSYAHSVVLKMDGSFAEQRAALLAGGAAPVGGGETAPNATSSLGKLSVGTPKAENKKEEKKNYHSVVLSLDSDALDMRKKLLDDE
jgi:hypothetical protein